MKIKFIHPGIMHNHLFAIGMDPITKFIYIINMTTQNPYKIHKGRGVTPTFYNEVRQSIINIPDTGTIITTQNPKYETYLKIYQDKNNLSPNQTLSELLNTGKISPIGFEDKYQQKLLKDNIPGYDEWQKKVYKWKTPNTIISPVPDDVLGMKKLHNAQAVLRVEQTADAQEFLVSTCKEVKKTSVKSVSDLANIILENNSRFILPKITTYHSAYNKTLISKEDLENKAKYEAKNNLFYAPDLQSRNTNYIANVKQIIPNDIETEHFETVILPQESFITEKRNKIISPLIGNNTVYEEGQKKGCPPSNNKIYVNRDIDNNISAKRVSGKITQLEKEQINRNRIKGKQIRRDEKNLDDE